MDSSKPKHYKRVFLLSAKIKKGINGGFVLAEADKGGPFVSKWRLQAAKKILDLAITDRLVIVGAKEDDIADQEVWRPEVMRGLLVEHYGVSADAIEVRKQAVKGTRGNVIEIQGYLAENKLVAGECAFLTNFYHIPRAATFFLEYGLALRPIAAECFLVDEEAEAIKKDYGMNNSEFSVRLVKELKGLRAFEFGEYDN